MPGAALRHECRCRRRRRSPPWENYDVSYSRCRFHVQHHMDDTTVLWTRNKFDPVSPAPARRVARRPPACRTRSSRHSRSKPAIRTWTEAGRGRTGRPPWGCELKRSNERSIFLWLYDPTLRTINHHATPAAGDDRYAIKGSRTRPRASAGSLFASGPDRVLLSILSINPG